MNFELGQTSLNRLNTCHKDLQLIILTSISISDIDFGVAEGNRPDALQIQYFKEGKSKIDGVNVKSKHQFFPSLALDYYPYVNNKANYDNEHLTYLAGLFHGVSGMLFKEGKITHKLRWGGNFDMDGELLEQSFKDRPHIELINA